MDTPGRTNRWHGPHPLRQPAGLSPWGPTCQRFSDFESLTFNKGPHSRAKLAEGEGFEPPVGCPTPVFKTAALNHSANLPWIPLLGRPFRRARRLAPKGVCRYPQGSLERCRSGRSGAPAKRVYWVNQSRGFESPSLRHQRPRKRALFVAGGGGFERLGGELDATPSWGLTLTGRRRCRRSNSPFLANGGAQSGSPGGCWIGSAPSPAKARPERVSASGNPPLSATSARDSGRFFVAGRRITRSAARPAEPPPSVPAASCAASSAP